MDKGDTGCRQSFIIFAKASIEAEPSEGTFHNPTAGQYGETLLLLWAKNRPKAEAEALRNPCLQRVTIGSVNPDETQFLAEAAASSE